MKKKKLKNAPLKEVIFELLWELPIDPTGFPIDTGFELAQGVFASKIKSEFPIHKKTVPDGFQNIRIYPKPIHQFWKKELTWPVVQLGQGIVTLNDTEANYIWEDNFFPNIKNALDVLISSYTNPLKFNAVSLKYIDSIDILDKETNLTEFLNKNFQTGIVNNYKMPGKLTGLNINQVFQMEDSSIMQINIQTAKNNASNQPAIVWITGIEKKGFFEKEDILNWVIQAHEKISDTFVNMLDKDFYENFDK